MDQNAESAPSKQFPSWRFYPLAGAACLLVGCVYLLVYALSSRTVGLGPVPIELAVLAGLGMALVAVGWVRSKGTAR